MARPRRTPTPTPAPSRTIPPAQQELSDARIAALAHAITEQIMAELRQTMPIYARIAAADLRHTLQRPETVLADAIDEGMLAARLIDEKTGGAA